MPKSHNIDISLILPERLRSEMASKSKEVNSLCFEIETFLETIENDRATNHVPQLSIELDKIHLMIEKYPMDIGLTRLATMVKSEIESRSSTVQQVSALDTTTVEEHPSQDQPGTVLSNHVLDGNIPDEKSIADQNFVQRELNPLHAACDNLAALSDEAQNIDLNLYEKLKTVGSTLEKAVNKTENNILFILDRLSSLESRVGPATTARPNVPTIQCAEVPVEGESQIRVATAMTSRISLPAEDSFVDRDKIIRKGFVETSILDKIRKMNKISGISLDVDSSHQFILECYKNKSPSLEADITGLQKLIADYFKEFEQQNTSILRTCDIALNRSRNWILSTMAIYDSLEVYRASKDSLVTISKFSPESEVNVYEFLEKFMLKFRDQGNDKERGEKLWEEYLPDSIKVKTEAKKSSYRELKEYLIQRYGSLNFLLTNTLALIAKENKSASSSNGSRLKLFTKVLLLLQKLESAKKFNKADLISWDHLVYSATTLSHVRNIMTQSEWMILSQNLTQANESSEEISGPKAFEIIKATMNSLINAYTWNPQQPANEQVNVIAPSQSNYNSGNNSNKKPFHK